MKYISFQDSSIPHLLSIPRFALRPICNINAKIDWKWKLIVRGEFQEINLTDLPIAEHKSTSD